MEKCVCKFEIKKEKATGFFCKIPFPDKNNMLKVFIANDNIVDERITKIEIEINKDNYIKEFNLKDRLKYNKDFEITIIEIKEEDKINDYLELDDNIINNVIYNKNEIEEYKGNGIYIMQYPEGDLSISFGVIKSNDEYIKDRFPFLGSTGIGSSGAPIITFNKKVIGMHYASNKNNKQAQFLHNPIKEFIKKNYKNNIPIHKIENVNLIKEKMGLEIYKKLDELYLSFQNSYYNNYSKKKCIKLNEYKNIIKQIDNYVYKIKI